MAIEGIPTPETTNDEQTREYLAYLALEAAQMPIEPSLDTLDHAMQSGRVDDN